MTRNRIHAPDGGSIPGSLCEEPTGDVSTFECDAEWISRSVKAAVPLLGEPLFRWLVGRCSGVGRAACVLGLGSAGGTGQLVVRPTGGWSAGQAEVLAH
jgi:hypothetical protein